MHVVCLKELEMQEGYHSPVSYLFTYIGPEGAEERAGESELLLT